MATAGRRKLHFDRFDQVRSDVDALVGAIEAGRALKTAGKWSLAQICSHLATAFACSVDGYPGTPAPWLLRATLGRVARTSMLSFHYLPEGAPLPKDFLPVPDLDLSAQRHKLFHEIDRFLQGPLTAGHPFLGSMTRPQWTVFHLVHCSHHLSFVSVASS